MTYGISDNSGVCKFSFGGRQEKGSKLEIKRLHMLSTDESCRKKKFYPHLLDSRGAEATHERASCRSHAKLVMEE